MRSSPGTPASVISAPVNGSTIRASVVRDMVIDQSRTLYRGKYCARTAGSGMSLGTPSSAMPSLEP
jgi:hypothetical protein